MSFLRRPRLKTNEIFSSYLLRLTQQNSYSNYQAILDYVDINSDLHKLNYLPEDEADLTVLGQMAQIEDAQLWDAIFPAICDRKVKAYGSIIDYEWLEREKLKICPSCFASNGYYQKHWSLWCYTSCYLHQCLLVDRCPQCQFVWKWDDLKNDWKCRCGWNFAETPIYKIQPEENNLSKLVAHSCKLAETGSIAIERQSPLFSLSLS